MVLCKWKFGTWKNGLCRKHIEWQPSLLPAFASSRVPSPSQRNFTIPSENRWKTEGNMPSNGLFIQLFSLHGLVRAENLELGRDADTGGQIKYVVELAKALEKREDVKRWNCSLAW
jgi:hypothetical protein